jgi:ubiquinone/menaquinone biosynthesis C-methylase UbiE
MYDIARYWERVAHEIKARRSGSDVAGYDTPADRYLRHKGEREIRAIDVHGKSVLEVGCGTGLNLALFDAGGAASIIGVDVSATMLNIAKRRMSNARARTRFEHVGGDTLPLGDRSVDCTFTVTVLQHNTDDHALRRLISEIARVTSQRIIILEQTGPIERRSESFVNRRPSFYVNAFTSSGMQLIQRKVIRTFVTKKFYAITSRFFGLQKHHEGAASSRGLTRLLNAALPVTAALDRLVPVPDGLTVMVFERR